MTYPLSFRKLVISHIAEGSSNTIYRWGFDRENLSTKRKRNGDCWKLDRKRLIEIVENNPDIMLKQYAQILGVVINAVWHSLKLLGYTRKKMARYKEKKTL